MGPWKSVPGTIATTVGTFNIEVRQCLEERTAIGMLLANNGKAIIYVPTLLETFHQLPLDFCSLSSLGKRLNIAYHDQTITRPEQKDVETFWR